MKKPLMLFLVVCTLFSCDNFPSYKIKINETQEYNLKTDCGELRITATVTDMRYSTLFHIDFSADSLKRKYTIIPEKFRLYVNSKRITLKKAYVDHKKTEFAIDGSARDTIGQRLNIYLLADSAIMCNGQSLIKKDTLRFEILANRWVN